MKSRYLDPCIDVAFKKVFREPGRLKDFLNAILRLPEGLRIQEIEFMAQEELPDLHHGKRSIFDLKCKDEAGNRYVVEMQNSSEQHFLKRVQYYASHTYVSQLPQGKLHDDLMPVILVAISKHKLFPEEVECVSYHKMREDKTKKQHLFELSYVFVELSKFKKTEEELSSIEEYWLYFLARAADVKSPPTKMKDEFILKAYETIEQFNWNEAEYDAYIRSKLLMEVEEINLKTSYSDGVAKGLEEGVAKGKAEGLEEGVAKGKAEGLEEGAFKEKLSIAKSLLVKGLPLDFITETTGLTKEEIEKLAR